MPSSPSFWTLLEVSLFADPTQTGFDFSASCVLARILGSQCLKAGVSCTTSCVISLFDIPCVMCARTSQFWTSTRLWAFLEKDLLCAFGFGFSLSFCLGLRVWVPLSLGLSMSFLTLFFRSVVLSVLALWTMPCLGLCKLPGVLPLFSLNFLLALRSLNPVVLSVRATKGLSCLDFSGCGLCVWSPWCLCLSVPLLRAMASLCFLEMLVTRGELRVEGFWNSQLEGQSLARHRSNVMFLWLVLMNG